MDRISHMMEVCKGVGWGGACIDASGETVRRENQFKKSGKKNTARRIPENVSRRVKAPNAWGGSSDTGSSSSHTLAPPLDDDKGISQCAHSTLHA